MKVPLVVEPEDSKWRKSCYRFVLLSVLLAGVIIDKGFYSQELLQGLAES